MKNVARKGHELNFHNGHQLATNSVINSIASSLRAGMIRDTNTLWTLKLGTRRLFISAIQVMDFEEYAGLVHEALILLEALHTEG